MLIALASSLLVSLAMFGFVVIRAARAGFPPPMIAGAATGIALGAALVIVLIVATRQTLRRGKDEKMTQLVLGGFALKLIGLLVLGGLIWAVKGEDVEPGIEPLSAFLAYLGAIFLGYAWQARIAESPVPTDAAGLASGVTETPVDKSSALR